MSNTKSLFPELQQSVPSPLWWWGGGGLKLPPTFSRPSVNTLQVSRPPTRAGWR